MKLGTSFSRCMVDVSSKIMIERPSVDISFNTRVPISRKYWMKSRRKNVTKLICPGLILVNESLINICGITLGNIIHPRYVEIRSDYERVYDS